MFSPHVTSRAAGRAEGFGGRQGGVERLLREEDAGVGCCLIFEELEYVLEPFTVSVVLESQLQSSFSLENSDAARAGRLLARVGERPLARAPCVVACAPCAFAALRHLPSPSPIDERPTAALPTAALRHQARRIPPAARPLLRVRRRCPRRRLWDGECAARRRGPPAIRSDRNSRTGDGSPLVPPGPRTVSTV